jgi:two-component system LytT family response regulator
MSPTRALRVVVVDDVALARARLARLLAELPGIELAGAAADAGQGVALIERERPDVVLLDIDLPGADGFNLVARLDVRPEVVFCTAFSEHAARAFTLGAADYLLKPIAPERLREAMQRCLRRRSEREPAPRWLVLRERGQVNVLAAEDVDWIESAGNYVCIRAAGTTHVHRGTLSGIHRRLDPVRFVRIHRSRVVNLARIARLEPLHNGDHRVVLRDGTALVLSRTWRDALFARLEAADPGHG